MFSRSKISLTVPKAPTLSLPPLGRLASHTPCAIKAGLENVKNLYFRPNPCSFTPLNKHPHFIHDASVPDSGYASAEDDDDSDGEIGVLLSDQYERNFTIKWLTGFIARSDTWVQVSPEQSGALESDADERSDIVDLAVALLSAFNGTAEDDEVALTRIFTFNLKTSPSSMNSSEISIELNDAPLEKNDHTSVGLQSWGSSILFAERICADPWTFGLSQCLKATDSARPFRVLELGSGTGVLSIVAAKVLQQLEGDVAGCPGDFQVVATDYHPLVLSNLARNIGTNFCSGPLDQIFVKPLDWSNPLPSYGSAPFDRPFDVILAADVIYQPEHATWIRGVVEALLRREGNGGVFWLFIPVRKSGRHEGMDRTVDKLFSREHSVSWEAGPQEEKQLVILHREEVDRQGGVGRVDEAGYRLYKIGWAK